NDFKPAVGHRFNLRRTPKPDMEIVIDCQVVAVEPHKTLSYSWVAFGLKSVVTFTLTPTSAGTHLRMEQAGFGPGQGQAYAGAKGGWQAFLENLDQVLARID